jgi:hypothetical protein
MKSLWLVAVLFAGCAHSEPPPPGPPASADQALADTARPPNDDDCGSTHRHLENVDGDGDPKKVVAAEVVVAVAADAMDEKHNKRVAKCNADKAHDARADRIQQHRADRVATDAQSLTQRAKVAAQAGDCATVTSLEGSVDDDDPAYHDKYFVTDPDIQKCLKH